VISEIGPTPERSPSTPSAERRADRSDEAARRVVRQRGTLVHQQFPGLSPQLIDVGIHAHRARGRVRPANGHDELLSRPCRRHSLARPLSALPGRKRDHPDDDKTDVGVDAVLSADGGDAPMRQRQNTAPVEASSALAPHAVRENTTRVKSRYVEEAHRPFWLAFTPAVVAGFDYPRSGAA
jgi:hypothetical protein